MSEWLICASECSDFINILNVMAESNAAVKMLRRDSVRMHMKNAYFILPQLHMDL